MFVLWMTAFDQAIGVFFDRFMVHRVSASCGANEHFFYEFIFADEVLPTGRVFAFNSQVAMDAFIETIEIDDTRRFVC